MISVILIMMLCCLLLKELAAFAFDDDLHRIIYVCRLVETMSKGFAYDRAS
jgi:hypothetical protein